MALLTSSSAPSKASTASRSIASRNPEFRRKSSTTVSLKGRLSGMSAFLATLIIGPALLSVYDILLLALFRAACEQEHECLAVLPKIDAITRTEVDLKLAHSAPNAFHVR